MSPLERIAPLKPLVSFPITGPTSPVPAWNESMGGPKTTTVILELDRLSKINGQQSGRMTIAFIKGPDGKYVVAYKAERLGATESQIFRGIPRPEPGSRRKLYTR